MLLGNRNIIDTLLSGLKDYCIFIEDYFVNFKNLLCQKCHALMILFLLKSVG